MRSLESAGTPLVSLRQKHNAQSTLVHARLGGHVGSLEMHTPGMMRGGCAERYGVYWYLFSNREGLTDVYHYDSHFDESRRHVGGFLPVTTE